MKKSSGLIRRSAAFFLTAIMLFGVCISTANAAIEFEPTIRMGDTSPMTRDEFLEWGRQRGIRHVNIEGRIYPLIIFFRGGNGQAFTHGEINGHILYVFHRPGATSEPRIVRLQENYLSTAHDIKSHDTASPILFCSLAPIHLSHDELTAIMAVAPLNPMYTRSGITLSNRRMTEAEIDAWIDEYNEMGGASALELAVIMEVNRVRAEYGLHSLALSPALMMSARLKTQEFGDLQYFGHHSPVHGSPTEAARLFGVAGMVGENISRTGSNVAPVAPRAERVVGGMLASSRGHREVLLSPYVQSVGFGSFFSPNSTGATGNLTHVFYVATKFGF
jgi:uncharacterized protein YkwD